MFKEVSNIIYNILSTDTELAPVVGTKIFPMVADQKTQLPFITFDIQENANYSKDQRNEYEISINGYHGTFPDVADLSDTIKNAMINSIGYTFYYMGASTAVLDEKVLIIKHSYKFKK